MKLKDTGERLIAKGNEQTLTYGEHLSRYLAVCDLVKDKTILDVASGTGYGTAMIADAGAKEVHGLDYSEDAVEYANDNYSRDNVIFAQGDAHNLPYEGNSMDVVVSLETIEHLTNPKKFISEVKRVLKKNGVFIVSTPNDDEFMEGNDFHLHEFQLPELKRLIDSNFVKSKYYFQGTYFSVALQEEEEISKPYEARVELTKTFSQQKEKAIYFIAIATDGEEIPNLRQNVVLADRWNTKEDIERDQIRVQNREKLEKDTLIYKSKVDELSVELSNVYNSTSWRITKWLRDLRRLINR